MDNIKKSNKKHLYTVLFIVYMAFLIYFLFFSDVFGRTTVYDHYRYSIVPFTEIKRYWNLLIEGDWMPFIINVCGNVILFMPFGYMFGMFADRKQTGVVMGLLDTFVAAFLMILIVETCQLLTKVGVFDVDDIILNVSGALLGYVAYRIVRYIKHGKGKSNDKKKG